MTTRPGWASEVTLLVRSGIAAGNGKELKDSGRRPRRSLLFLVVTGEEKGLLGSKYFAVHPAVPEKSMVADINMDMFYRFTRCMC